MTSPRLVTNDIDDIAVELACRGERSGQLNRGERREVVQRLTRRGVSAQQIAARIGRCERTVVRDRQILGISQHVPHLHGDHQERAA